MAGFLSSVARQFLLWDLLAVPFAVSCDFSRGRLIVLSSFTVTVKGFGEPGKTGTPAPFCASLPKRRLVKATGNESRFHAEDLPRFARNRPDFPPSVLLTVLRCRPDCCGVQPLVCNGCGAMFIIVRHPSVLIVTTRHSMIWWRTEGELDGQRILRKIVSDVFRLRNQSFCPFDFCLLLQTQEP